MNHLNVVFDLDDTLMPTRWRYSLAKYRSGIIIAEALGKQLEVGTVAWGNQMLMKASYQCAIIIVNALLSDTPYGANLLRRARGLGPSSVHNLEPKTFQQSWFRCYELCCQDCDCEPDPIVLEKLRRATSRFSRNPYRQSCRQLYTGDVSGYGVHLIDLQGKIDNNMIGEFGFSVKRFSESWVATYRSYCIENQYEFDEDVAKRVSNAAAGFRRGPFKAYPESFEVLTWVKRQGHTMYLLTAGEQGLQRRKIKQTGLEAYFAEDKIYVVAHDKRPPLKEIANGQPQQTVMVGDSLRSDIAAACDVGVRAVYIPTRGHWINDDAKVSRNKFTQLTSIKELPDVIAGMTKRKGRKKRSVGKTTAGGKK